MIDQPPEWTNGVKKELELYGDYKKGVGQIENPKDISKVVFAAVAKSRATPPLDEMKISCRLYSEAQDCSEEHLRRRMADLRARNMGFGSNIDDTNRLVDDARVAFRRWALSQGLGLDHYEEDRKSVV